MKKRQKWFAVLLLSLLIISSMVACGNDGSNNPSEDGDNSAIQVPQEVQAVKDKVITLAADNATKLNGEFGDQHAALVASGEGRDNANYPSMLEKLNQIKAETGAYYVYTLIDADPNDTGFNVIVDNSAEPKEYMSIREAEGQFADALAGIPASALSAWDNNESKDQEDLCWTAAAPIYDTQGNIVAILVIDYPCPEIKEFPEWNRDSKKWNGMLY